MENMENQKISNPLSQATEKKIVQRESHPLNKVTRKLPLEKYKEKRKSRLISIISSQLANIPSFIEQANKTGEIILDFSKEIAEMLANGEIDFASYSQTGEKYAQFINKKTGKIFKNIPIKELPIELGSSIATAGLSMKLEQITHELNILGEKVDRVNRNFDLNRFAEVQSARDKFEMALLTSNLDTKKALLLDSLMQSTNAKNLFLNQLIEIKLQFEHSKSSSKIPIFNQSMSASDADKLAIDALDNLSYMKDAFGSQIETLFELGEFDVLNHTVYGFKETIIQNFSDEHALFLDEQLSNPTNPFKFLSNNIVEASNSIVEYLDHNQEYLDHNVIPNLLKNSDQKEFNWYGNE